MVFRLVASLVILAVIGLVGYQLLFGSSTVAPGASVMIENLGQEPWKGYRINVPDNNVFNQGSSCEALHQASLEPFTLVPTILNALYADGVITVSEFEGYFSEPVNGQVKLDEFTGTSLGSCNETPIQNACLHFVENTFLQNNVDNEIVILSDNPDHLRRQLQTVTGESCPE